MGRSASECEQTVTHPHTTHETSAVDAADFRCRVKMSRLPSDRSFPSVGKYLCVLYNERMVIFQAGFYWLVYFRTKRTPSSAHEATLKTPQQCAGKPLGARCRDSGFSSLRYSPPNAIPADFQPRVRQRVANVKPVAALPPPAAAAAAALVAISLVLDAANNNVDPAVEQRGSRQRGDVHFRPDALQAQNRLPRNEWLGSR